MYIELAGSHAHKDAGSAPEELVALMETRHTIDRKMQQSEVSVFKVSKNPSLSYFALLLEFFKFTKSSVTLLKVIFVEFVKAD